MQPWRDYTRRIYRRYIHPLDPAALIFRHTLKTMAAMTAVLLLFHPLGRTAVWGALAAMFLSQVPPGLPLHQRRRAMLWLVAAAAALMPPATLLGAGVIAPTTLALLATFAAFWFAALGPAYGACSLWALLLTVMALGNPGGWGEALLRVGAVAAGGMLAWGFHFLLFPLRPGRLLRTALSLLFADLDEVFRLLEGGFQEGRVDEQRLARLKERALNSLHRFRRLPQFLELSPGPGDDRQNTVLSLGLDLVRVYENLLALWQLRAAAGDSPLFSELLPRLSRFVGQTHRLFGQMAQAVQKRGGRVDGGPLRRELAAAIEQLRQRRQEQKGPGPREWIVVFNSLYALESLARDLGQAERQRRAVELLYPEQGRPAPPEPGRLQRLRAELNWGSPSLRVALQAAGAAGAAMFLAKFFDLRYGYWVVIFALLAVKPDLGSSLKMGKKRLWGTLLGAGAAIAFLLLWGGEGPLYLTVLGLGVFATLYSINFARPLLGGVVTTFTMVMLVSTFTPLGWRLGLLRLSETALAVAIGLAAAWLLWPNRASTRLRGELSRGLARCRDLFSGVFAGFLAGGLDTARLGGERQALQEALSQGRGTLAAAGQEPGRHPGLARHFGELALHLQRIFDLLLTLEATASQSPAQGLQQRLRPELTAFAGQVEATLDSLAAALHQRAAPRDLPDLGKAFQAIRRRQHQLQGQSARPPDTEELLNLSAFLWGLHGLVIELAYASGAVQQLAQD